MTVIYANLIGNPRVYTENKQITFPFGKAEALFYYLLVNKRVQRDVLVNLFWGDTADSVAKKNLRNAVYIIKKIFNEDVLISPQRNIVELNPNIQFKIDIDKIFTDAEAEFTEVYRGEFLGGFFVKNAEFFEEWMISIRNYYNETYINKLFKESEKSINNNNLIQAEKYYKMIINIDPLEEKAYRSLMQIYSKEGKYNKCISTYNNLVKLLNEELSILPDSETMKLFEEISKERYYSKFLNKNKKQEYLYEINNETISSQEQKLLDIASVFIDKFSFEDLQKIILLSEFELIEIIEALQKKQVIKETIEDENISFTFTHKKLKKSIYSQLTLLKKRLLHNKIGDMIENQLRGDYSDSLLYSKLIYHFENSRNKFKVLKYRLKNLEEYLQFKHEIFPIIIDNDTSKHKNIYLKEDVYEELNKINILLENIKNEDEYNEEIIRLEIFFLHITGRYYIMKGDYDSGLDKINKMIEKSLSLNDYKFALKGYFKIIYYCINIHDIRGMSENITRALQIVKKHGKKGELGILLRLKGFQKIMEGKLNEGDKLLQSAIDVFNRLEDKQRYIFNIAASYNYLGESKRLRGEFENAIYWYDKAIYMCEEKGLLGGLAISNTNAGQASYHMGDYEKAKKYFIKAIKLYEQFDFIWERSITNAYMALLLIREGNHDKATIYLNKVEVSCENIQSKYELDLVSKIKEEIYKYIN